jgi:hypothetical protein
MFYLFQRQLNNLDWVRTLGQGIDKFLSFGLVSESIQADQDMFTMQAHEAIGMVDDIASLVLGLKRYSFVRLIFTVHADAVPFVNKLVDDVDMSSVGSSSVEFPVAVVKHDRPLAFKGFALRLEMCQVYDVLVTSL